MHSVSLNATETLTQSSTMICQPCFFLFVSFPVLTFPSQGTGAVTLSCLMAAIGVTKTKLSDQRIIIYGAGSAGLGISKQLRDAMVTTDNISVEAANDKFWLIDKHGLIKESLPDVRDDLKAFVRKDSEWAEWSSQATRCGKEG